MPADPPERDQGEGGANEGIPPRLTAFLKTILGGRLGVALVAYMLVFVIAGVVTVVESLYTLGTKIFFPDDGLCDSMQDVIARFDVENSAHTTLFVERNQPLEIAVSADLAGCGQFLDGTVLDIELTPKISDDEFEYAPQYIEFKWTVDSTTLQRDTQKLQITPLQTGNFGLPFNLSLVAKEADPRDETTPSTSAGRAGADPRPDPEEPSAVDSDPVDRVFKVGVYVALDWYPDPEECGGAEMVQDTAKCPSVWDFQP